MKFSRRIAYCAMCANNGRITPDAAYVTRLGPSHVAHTASGAIPQLLFRGSDLIDIPSNDDGEDRNNKSYISSTTHLVYTWWAQLQVLHSQSQIDVCKYFISRGVVHCWNTLPATLMRILAVVPHSNGCCTQVILVVLHCFLHDVLFLLGLQINRVNVTINAIND